MMFDFQTLRYSSPMIDLAVFLANSTGTDVRSTHFSFIFKTYHEEVIKTLMFTLKKFRPDIPEIYWWVFNGHSPGNGNTKIKNEKKLFPSLIYGSTWMCGNLLSACGLITRMGVYELIYERVKSFKWSESTFHALNLFGWCFIKVPSCLIYFHTFKKLFPCI